jgi:hypothetical protein
MTTHRRTVVSQHPLRRIDAIDADLLSYCSFRRDANNELAEVRRRQAELAELEAALVVALETRADLADRLLDERLRAAPTAYPVPAWHDSAPRFPLVGIP